MGIAGLMGKVEDDACVSLVCWREIMAGLVFSSFLLQPNQTELKSVSVN
jgi:hypothetical protein